MQLPRFCVGDRVTASGFHGTVVGVTNVDFEVQWDHHLTGDTRTYVFTRHTVRPDPNHTPSVVRWLTQ